MSDEYEKLGLNIKENREIQNLREVDGKLNYKKFYEVVASKNCIVCGQKFDKGKPKFMNGLLARACVANGEGYVKVIDQEQKAKEEAKKAELAKIKAELKAELEAESKANTRTKKTVSEE